MTEPNNSFSMKELITEFVIPRLDKIDAKLDGKADHVDLAQLEERVSAVEKNTLTNDGVKQIIADVLKDAEARGWTRKELTIAVVGAIFVVLTFALSVATFVAKTFFVALLFL